MINCEVIIQIDKNSNANVVRVEIQPVSSNEFFNYLYIYGDYCTEMKNVDNNYPKSIEFNGINVYDSYNGFYYEENPNATSECSINHCAKTIKKGLYIISFYVNEQLKNKLFYDNRHKYFVSSCEANLADNDLTIKYDVNLNKVFYSLGFNQQVTQSPPFLSIKKNEVINWWELNGISINTFEGFNDRAFPVLNKPQSVYDSPQLTWSQPMEMTGFLRYELERSGGMYTGGQQPPSSEFITIFSTSNQLSYLDQQIPWIEELFFDNLIQYRVCAVYSDGRKEYSNIEKITTSKYHFKQAAIINSNNAELNVIQAYPNPFNPTCKINYNINTSGLAKLVLFNSLGQEIQILENGNLECGLHETIVNGTKLSSGIYFLQLKQETGISTIKLLLEK